jgi:hypothetical protein
MPPFSFVECDIVLSENGVTLCTLQLPVVPRLGEEIALDFTGEKGVIDGLYRVKGVRFHVRPRTFTAKPGDLYGVLVLVERVP